MRRYNLLTLLANFSAVILLTALIVTPLYFARNFAKVAGVKSFSKFLVVSQVEKFPNLKLTQEGDKYTISFSKQGPAQAFLGVLIVNNPTNQTQNYRLEVYARTAQVFFGEDIKNPQVSVSVPSTASVSVSLLSTNNVFNDQTAQFRITAAGE